MTPNHWKEGSHIHFVNCGVTVYQYDIGKQRLVLRDYNLVGYQTASSEAAARVE